jgi:hypothetical protein
MDLADVQPTYCACVLQAAWEAELNTLKENLDKQEAELDVASTQLSTDEA